MDKALLQLFFPQGLLDYFELTNYEQREDQYIFYLEEKNLPPKGYRKEDLESKGFYNEESVRDFPLRGRPCVLKIKRRKWLHKLDQKIVKRDWNIVAKGTRMSSEFASFLKEPFGYHTD
ncbi:MAG: transposase [Bacteroidota bacterium]